MKTIESLQVERTALIEKLRSADGRKDNSILLEIRAIDAEITRIKSAQLLERVNREQNDLRTVAKQVWECEQPETDITNADGSFHAVKVRKYPNLAALKYPSATWKDGRIKTIRVGRKDFQMFVEKSEYGKPTEYSRPESFEAFLKLNSIMPEPLTADQFAELTAKNEAITAEYKKAVERFDEEKKALKIHSYSYWGLFGQHNAGHTQEYRPNF